MTDDRLAQRVERLEQLVAAFYADWLRYLDGTRERAIIELAQTETAAHRKRTIPPHKERSEIP